MTLNTFVMTYLKFNCQLFLNLLYSLSVMEKLVKLKKVKRARKHGFLSRMASHGGQKVLKRRRAKNRNTLTI